MRTHNLGYPRIGNQRELKKACEKYWSGKCSPEELLAVGKEIRKANWNLQKEVGLDLIPSNDFSYYDQVLDMSLTVGAIPERYQPLEKENFTELDLYFAMARGFQKDGYDITAMEMTKWFDTNYHYIVPEFTKDQTFTIRSRKLANEFLEAKRECGIITRPVVIGPVSYLLLGKEKEAGFDKLDLLDRLLPVYEELLQDLVTVGGEWVQLDEPFLTHNLNKKEIEAFRKAYSFIKERFPNLKTLVTTYFNGLEDHVEVATSLPVCALHVDLVRDPGQLDSVLKKVPEDMTLSLGVVDGRNIWKSDFDQSLELIARAKDKLGADRVFVGPSCSLLHVPCDLDLETNEEALPSEIKNWLAFAKQKLDEIVTIADLADQNTSEALQKKLEANRQVVASRKTSGLIHDQEVKSRLSGLKENDAHRNSTFITRRELQREHLNLPEYPTTTIGSFPQTTEVRKLRSRFKKGELTHEQYEAEIEKATIEAIRTQEEIGLDVLVHGEFERNDMVEYFGEQLEGFAFTKFGWVQSYGSRCVKPPIIYGDVSRTEPMTVRWSSFAQNQTEKPVKGMLTGPVTILQWSFVRNDQPRSQTSHQIALAIRDEVVDLEKAGIRVIQVDEPAIREGLPLRRKDWGLYLDWAVKAFRIATSGVKDETQIHTHMCYSEFNDIIEHIASMDADVITIECSRSQMELLDAFGDFNYPNEIGPGVYDIHSPRVPSSQEMVDLLDKAREVIPEDKLWVNPDCGLKTRGWEETKAALKEMVDAAREMRASRPELV